MSMKEHLLDLFRYNDITNKKLLTRILQLNDKEEAVKLFSHLINSQYKWMARITQDPNAPQMSWWDPIYSLAELEIEWTKSLTPWMDYLNSKSDTELDTEIQFTGFDNGLWAAKPKDIALQLNLHSVHHRAQVQTIIRQQGIEPDFVDYIGTRYRKLN